MFDRRDALAGRNCANQEGWSEGKSGQRPLFFGRSKFLICRSTYFGQSCFWPYRPCPHIVSSLQGYRSSLACGGTSKKNTRSHTQRSEHGKIFAESRWFFTLRAPPPTPKKQQERFWAKRYLLYIYLYIEQLFKPYVPSCVCMFCPSEFLWHSAGSASRLFFPWATSWFATKCVRGASVPWCSDGMLVCQLHRHDQRNLHHWNTSGSEGSNENQTVFSTRSHSESYVLLDVLCTAACQLSEHLLQDACKSVGTAFQSHVLK